MADPTGIAPYLVANNSQDSLVSNARTLAVAPGSGLSTADGGPGNDFTLNTIEALNAINNLGTTGFIVNTGSASPYFQTRSFVSTDNSITITHSEGLTGNPNFSVTPGITVQKINYFYNTTTAVGTGSNLNLIAGDGVDITAQFDSETGLANYIFTSAGGGGGGGTITQITSTGATLNITDSEGPITNIDIAVTNSPQIGDYLKVTGISPTLLTWSTESGGGGITTLTGSNGITVTGGTTATANVALPGGATSGQVLTYNGTNYVWGAGGGAGDITSVDITSSTGIIITPTSPVTSGAATFTVDFPRPISEGSLLRGTSDGDFGPYDLPADSNTYVLTSDGTNFGWAPPPSATGSGGVGTLTGAGGAPNNYSNFITDTDITDSSTIVVTGWGHTDGTPLTPAAGPMTVLVTPGSGFLISGDSTDTGKGFSYQIDGGGAGGAISSIAGGNGLTVTGGTGPNATVSLPAALTGNLLIGNGSIYIPLGIDTTPGHVLTSTGVTAHWAPPSGSSGVSSLTSTDTGLLLSSTTGAITITNQWWNDPAATNISIGGFAIGNAGSLQLIDNTSIPLPPTAGGVLGIDLGVLTLNSSTITGVRNIVTASPTNYAAIGSILIGNGSGIYTTLAVGSSPNGDVLTLVSGVPAWAPASGGGGSVYGSGQLTTTASTLVVSAPGIQATSSVLVTGCGTSTNTPANGPFTVTINVGSGNFTIAGLTGAGSDQNKYVAYNYKV